LGNAGSAVGDFVVGFGVDDALKPFAVVAVGEGLGDAVHVAVGVAGGGHYGAHRVDKVGCPLGVESGSASSGGFCEPLVALEVFGDIEFPRLAGVDFVVYPLHEAPPIRVIAPVGLADVEGAVPSETVDVEVFEPHDGVVADVLADESAAEIWPCVAPGGYGSVVVIEKDSAASVLTPAIESPKVEIAGAVMVVDDIEEDSDAAFVAFIYESFESLGAAIGSFDAERICGVVSPTVIAGEFVYGEEFDGGDAEILEIVEFLDCGVKGSGSTTGDIVEGADVHLVDDGVVPGRG